MHGLCTVYAKILLLVNPNYSISVISQSLPSTASNYSSLPSSLLYSSTSSSTSSSAFLSSRHYAIFVKMTTCRAAISTLSVKTK
jgi:hypothetical protein